MDVWLCYSKYFNLYYVNQELTPTVDERVSTVPHLLNLNEDHMLSKLVRVYINQGM